MATKYKMKKLENGNIRTCEVRLSFPELFHAKQGTDDDGNPKGKPKFSTAVLFPEGADLSVLEKEIERIIAEDMKGKPRKAIRVGLRDQGEKDWDGYIDGAMFLNCSTVKRPPVVDKHREPVTEEDDAYPGVFAIVTLSPYGRLPKKGESFSPVVAFGLKAVQILGGGDRLGGGSADPNEEFEEVEGMDEGESADSIFGDE